MLGKVPLASLPRKGEKYAPKLSQKELVPPIAESHPEEAREAWMRRFTKFMMDRGTPLRRLPSMGKIPLDLYECYRVVVANGGFKEIVINRQWKVVADHVKIPASCTNSGYMMRTNYQKFLYPFERVDHFGLSDDPESRAEDPVLQAMRTGGDAALPDWPHAGSGGSKRSRSSSNNGSGDDASRNVVAKAAVVSAPPATAVLGGGGVGAEAQARRREAELALHSSRRSQFIGQVVLPLDPPAAMRRTLLALASGLPSETQWALDHLERMSAPGHLPVDFAGEVVDALAKALLDMLGLDAGKEGDGDAAAAGDGAGDEAAGVGDESPEPNLSDLFSTRVTVPCVQSKIPPLLVEATPAPADPFYGEAKAPPALPQLLNIVRNYSLIPEVGALVAKNKGMMRGLAQLFQPLEAGEALDERTVCDTVDIVVNVGRHLSLKTRVGNRLLYRLLQLLVSPYPELVVASMEGIARLAALEENETVLYQCESHVIAVACEYLPAHEPTAFLAALDVVFSYSFFGQHVKTVIRKRPVLLALIRALRHRQATGEDDLQTQRKAALALAQLAEVEANHPPLRSVLPELLESCARASSATSSAICSILNEIS